MSTQRGGVSKGPPKHRNKTAWKPNRDVKKNPKEPGGSDGKSFGPNSGVCERCHAQIEWRRKYGKYKALTEALKCNDCHKRAVRLAYHHLCQACARERNVCAKCCKPADEIVGSSREEEEAERRRLEEALRTLRERDRRTLLRQMEAGTAPKGLRRLPGNEGDDNASESDESTGAVEEERARDAEERGERDGGEDRVTDDEEDDDTYCEGTGEEEGITRDEEEGPGPPGFDDHDHDSGLNTEGGIEDNGGDHCQASVVGTEAKGEGGLAKAGSEGKEGVQDGSRSSRTRACQDE